MVIDFDESRPMSHRPIGPDACPKLTRWPRVASAARGFPQKVSAPTASVDNVDAEPVRPSHRRVGKIFARINHNMMCAETFDDARFFIVRHRSPITIAPKWRAH